MAITQATMIIIMITTGGGGGDDQGHLVRIKHKCIMVKIREAKT